ncbi:hypothetical protein [Brevundimonas vesicularis]|uniref:hypothetical protein n=1 Tax=Brevundimonas vesicularis TaxID=41276 RepID=UPI0022AC3D87|nr:hypothetical protein [Brevundimonas vesicularis]
MKMKSIAAAAAALLAAAGIASAAEAQNRQRSYAREDRQGYHLNMFASDTAMSGGGVTERLGRALANRLVGTPQEFTENMLRGTVQAIEARTGASAILIEGEPEIPGLAWKR